MTWDDRQHGFHAHWRVAGTPRNTVGKLVIVNAPTTLKALLQHAIDKRVQAKLPVDYRALETAVRDEEKVNPRGMVLNRTTVSQILKGTYKKEPEDGTIRAIGWLAGVSDEVAFTAAGHKPQGPPFATELPQGINDLTPAERQVALDLLRVLISQRREINRYADLLAESPSTSGTPRKARKGKEVGRRPSGVNPDPIAGLDAWRNDDGNGDDVSDAS